MAFVRAVTPHFDGSGMCPEFNVRVTIIKMEGDGKEERGRWKDRWLQNFLTLVQLEL